MEEEITFLRDQGRPSMLEVLMRDVGVAEWKQAESNRSLEYNKQSLRKKQLDKQKAKKAEEEAAREARIRKETQTRIFTGA